MTEVQQMKLADIHPYERNPRKIGKNAIEAVAKSIETFGWQQPIVVDKEHTIIVGHTRYLAAQYLGLKDAPVLVADLDEQKAKEYRIVDNKVAEFSRWDYSALLQELQAIVDFDMSDFGFAPMTADGEGGGGRMTNISACPEQAPSSIPTITETTAFLLFARIAASASRRIDMDLVMLNPKDIRPYKGNPRVNDDTVEYLMQSIKDYGFHQPIVVDQDMVILAGHARYKAALRLELAAVPVVIATGLSEEQAKAYRLADNKTGDLTQWDEKLLGDEASEVAEALGSYGIDLGTTSQGSPERIERTHKHICPRCKHEF